jgi:GntR family transcriptional regulator
MLLVEPNHGDPTPLHEQVAAALRRAIAEGEAKAGERLPTANDIATALGVNTNTVLRALRTLRDEGLLEFRRGRGITVAAGPDRGELIAGIRDLVRLARTHGYSRRDLIRLIEETR